MKINIPNKENHRVVWEWTAKNPNKYKSSWPGFNTIERLTGEVISAHCFACRETDFKCEECPVDWETVINCSAKCLCNDSIYMQYQKSEGEERARLARKIANNWR